LSSFFFSDNENKDSGLNPFEDDRVFIKRKSSKRDNRDLLPFTIYEIKTNPNESTNEIGTFFLDPTTSNGDILQVIDKTYVVEKIAFIYKFENRAHRVYKKKLYVAATKSFPWIDSKLTTESIFQ